jgi:hypothetical protein
MVRAGRDGSRTPGPRALEGPRRPPLVVSSSHRPLPRTDLPEEPSAVLVGDLLELLVEPLVSAHVLLLARDVVEVHIPPDTLPKLVLLRVQPEHVSCGICIAPLNLDVMILGTGFSGRDSISLRSATL